MQSDGQLDNAETRTQMTARYRDGINGLGPQLVRNLLQLLFWKAPEVFRRVQRIEEGGRDWQHERSRFKE